MGWNPFKKKSWKKVGKAIEKTAKDTGKVFEKVGDDVEKSFEELAAETERFFIKEAEQVVQQIFDKGKRDIERVAENALKETKDAFVKDLPALAEAAFAEPKEAFVEELPALLEEAIRKLASEASRRSIKGALDNAANVIEVMAPTRFTLIFGVELALVIQAEVTVSCSFPNPVAKLTEIREWAANPPRGRGQIIECIKDFGPESLAVEFKVSGNGMAAEWDGDDKYDRIDAFLEKHGL